MDGTGEQATIVWLPTEQHGLKDFWEVYDSHYDEISKGTMDALADDPELGPMMRAMPAEQAAENNRRSRELIRSAILNGTWDAYTADLRAQGTTYARGGLRFATWFTAVGAFREQVRPFLFSAYSRTPERLHADRKSVV